MSKYEVDVNEKNNKWNWEIQAETGNCVIVANGSNETENSAYINAYNAISTVNNHSLVAKVVKGQRRPYLWVGITLLISGIFRGIGIAIGYDLPLPWESLAGLILVGWNR
jgi:hypothetical protein